MDIMEEIFEIISCIEILTNDIKIDTTESACVLQLIQSIQIGVELRNATLASEPTVIFWEQMQ